MQRLVHSRAAVHGVFQPTPAVRHRVRTRAHALHRSNSAASCFTSPPAFRFLPNRSSANRLQRLTWSLADAHRLKKMPATSLSVSAALAFRSSCQTGQASIRRGFRLGQDPARAGFSQRRSFIYLIKSLVYKIVVVVNAERFCGQVEFSPQAQGFSALSMC